MATAKQCAANQRRSLKAIKAKLLRMCHAWGDLDGYFETRMDDLIKEVQRLDGEMAEFIAEGGGNDGNS